MSCRLSSASFACSSSNVKWHSEDLLPVENYAWLQGRRSASPDEFQILADHSVKSIDALMQLPKGHRAVEASLVKMCKLAVRQDFDRSAQVLEFVDVLLDKRWRNGLAVFAELPERGDLPSHILWVDWKLLQIVCVRVLAREISDLLDQAHQRDTLVGHLQMPSYGDNGL